MYWHCLVLAASFPDAKQGEDVRLTLYEIVKEQKIFGPERARTADLLLAKQALYQLSYRPKICIANFLTRWK